MISAEARMEQAKANRYSPEAHKTNNSIRNKTGYNSKTLKDQDKILNRYEMLVTSRALY